jgi:hypothetical protein
MERGRGGGQVPGGLKCLCLGATPAAGGTDPQALSQPLSSHRCSSTATAKYRTPQCWEAEGAGIAGRTRRYPAERPSSPRTPDLVVAAHAFAKAATHGEHLTSPARTHARNFRIGSSPARFGARELLRSKKERPAAFATVLPSPLHSSGARNTKGAVMAASTARSALVLYGSETGNAQDVAEEIGRLCERLRFTTHISDLNSASLVCTVCRESIGHVPRPSQLPADACASDNCSTMIFLYSPYPQPAKATCPQTPKPFGKRYGVCGSLQAA